MTTFNDKVREYLEDLWSQAFNIGSSHKVPLDTDAYINQALDALNQAHEEECLRVIGSNEYGNIGYDGEDMVDETTESQLARNDLRAEQRNRLKPTDGEK